MREAPKATILRIELWHAGMLLGVIAFLAPRHWVEPHAVLAGGVFMGVNFLLLSFGVASLLSGLGGTKRVKTGVVLLIIKMALFLGLLTLTFFKFTLDAISFSLGFSTLLLAIVIESVRAQLKVTT
jgi:hypothetical protein